jgi:hypothetical protein
MRGNIPGVRRLRRILVNAAAALSHRCLVAVWSLLIASIGVTAETNEETVKSKEKQ